MKHKIVVFILAACLLVGFVWSVAGREGNGSFIIVNADDSAYLDMMPSSTLNALLANVAPHVIVEFANDLRDYDMVTVPGALQTLLDQVDTHMIIEFANDNRFIEMGYPLDLIDDTSAPEISGITVTANGNSATINWTTSEYTTSELEYGTQSGVYTHTIVEDWYRRSHNMTLTELTSGETYYARIHSTDRSGNSSVSDEIIIDPVIKTYLPLVLR